MDSQKPACLIRCILESTKFGRGWDQLMYGNLTPISSCYKWSNSGQWEGLGYYNLLTSVAMHLHTYIFIYLDSALLFSNNCCKLASGDCISNYWKGVLTGNQLRWEDEIFQQQIPQRQSVLHTNSSLTPRRLKIQCLARTRQTPVHAIYSLHVPISLSLIDAMVTLASVFIVGAHLDNYLHSFN